MSHPASRDSNCKSGRPDTGIFERVDGPTLRVSPVIASEALDYILDIRLYVDTRKAKQDIIRERIHLPVPSMKCLKILT